MNNQKKLNKYFSKVWEPSPIGEWEYSGIQIIDKIKPHETVIDVGCGYNLFKDKIKNLLGIDPANDEADIKISLEHFLPDDKYDVALCLGSINFGDVNRITNQIAKVISILNDTSRIYWRCNPGIVFAGTLVAILGAPILTLIISHPNVKYIDLAYK